VAAKVRTRSIGNALAVIAMGIGIVAAALWWVDGRLSTIELIALVIGAYGVGVISARAIWSPLIKRMKKGQESKSANKLDDGGGPDAVEP
jgi:hypothetical protein